MESCELVPGRGICRGDAEIFFGMQRKELREKLGWKPGGANLWDDEDEYAKADGEDWFLLRFLDDKLCDIEVSGGSLVHAGIELVATNIVALRADLKLDGMVLEKTHWLAHGWDCVDLQIVVASKDDVDDVGEEIAWVIASSDFRIE